MGNILNKEGLEHLAEVLDEKYGKPIPQALVKTTYAELKALRDGGNLVAGTWYRITDYECTTTQENTRSAGHRFDVVVLALDNKTLSEEARACKHDGDTYFKDCKLEAWKIWYCIDNDETRFAWADEEGKGVIYRMIDEWNNDVPYDFKNIQFVRTTTDGIYDQGGEETYVYTFELYDQETYTHYDASTSQFVIPNDEGVYSHTYGNVIKRYGYGENDSISYGYPYRLNDIVFLNIREDGDFFYGCNSNTFGNDCHSNTFGNGCNSNTFGNDCHSNTFGNDCSANTFGNGCNSNTFGNYCNSNTFGNYCSANTFGNDCYSNTFGNYCNSNTFGNDCSANTFGNDCYSNTFGNDCSANTFFATTNNQYADGFNKNIVVVGVIK